MAARGDLPFDRRDVEAWLRARGTERIEHPGGTLHDHLRRVATLLGDWGAGPLLEAAGLCHGRRAARSEEHTSELQSRQYLVCRLLLEKKKNNHQLVREDDSFDALLSFEQGPA